MIRLKTNVLPFSNDNTSKKERQKRTKIYKLTTITRPIKCAIEFENAASTFSSEQSQIDRMVLEIKLQFVCTTSSHLQSTAIDHDDTTSGW